MNDKDVKKSVLRLRGMKSLHPSCVVFCCKLLKYLNDHLFNMLKFMLAQVQTVCCPQFSLNDYNKGQLRSSIKAIKLEYQLNQHFHLRD